MKAVGIIPARWQSTRFPGKPLHLIASKPLLRHVWETLSSGEEIRRNHHRHRRHADRQSSFRLVRGGCDDLAEAPKRDRSIAEVARKPDSLVLL